MKWFYRITAFSLHIFFRLFYRLSIYGVEAPYQGKAILASNHASFLDPPIIGAAWPEEVHFLARASLFRFWGWSTLLSALNAHPIHGTSQDIESFRLIYQLLNEGKKVVIFPEGERTATGALQSIKSGVAMLAMRAHCPIIPIYISGTFKAWPKHRRWLTLGPHIACVFGKPIFPQFSSDMNKKQVQEALSQQLQRELERLSLWFEAGAKGSLPSN